MRKKILLVLLGSMLSLLIAAQDNTIVSKSIPHFFNYHSITTELGKSVEVTIDILDENHESLYSEVHKVTTNSSGAFSLQIGKGKPSNNATLSSVDWEKAVYGRATIGTNESEFTLSSVPYAMLAKSVVGLKDSIISVVDSLTKGSDTENNNQDIIQQIEEINQQISQQTQEIGQQISQQTQEMGQQISQQTQEMGQQISQQTQEMGQQISLQTQEIGQQISQQTQEVQGNLYEQQVNIELIKQLIAGSNSQGRPVADSLNELLYRLLNNDKNNGKYSIVELLNKIIVNQVGEDSDYYSYPLRNQIDELRYLLFGNNITYNQSALYERITQLENKVNNMNYLLQDIHSRLFGY